MYNNSRRRLSCWGRLLQFCQAAEKETPRPSSFTMVVAKRDGRWLIVNSSPFLQGCACQNSSVRGGFPTALRTRTAVRDVHHARCRTHDKHRYPRGSEAPSRFDRKSPGGAARSLLPSSLGHRRLCRTATTRLFISSLTITGRLARRLRRPISANLFPNS